MHAEQSNSSVVYENRLVLKIFRRVEEGAEPDLEIGSLSDREDVISQRAAPGGISRISGVRREASTSLGILQGYVANQGDAWQFTLKALAEYYAKSVKVAACLRSEMPYAPLLKLCDQAIPDEAERGSELISIRRRCWAEGQRNFIWPWPPTTEDPDFAPAAILRTELSKPS